MAYKNKTQRLDELVEECTQAAARANAAWAKRERLTKSGASQTEIEVATRTCDFFLGEISGIATTLQMLGLSQAARNAWTVYHTLCETRGEMMIAADIALKRFAE